jgi:hypothetical protein
MSWKCFFAGHKMELTTQVKQKMVDEDGHIVGYDIYTIHKCERCFIEKGTYIDYFWKSNKSISPDYIRVAYGQSKE